MLGALSRPDVHHGLLNVEVVGARAASFLAFLSSIELAEKRNLVHALLRSDWQVARQHALLRIGSLFVVGHGF